MTVEMLVAEGNGPLLLVGVYPQACAFWDGRSPRPEAREARGEGAGMEVTHSEGRAWIKSESN